GRPAAADLPTVSPEVYLRHRRHDAARPLPEPDPPARLHDLLELRRLVRRLAPQQPGTLARSEPPKRARLPGMRHGDEQRSQRSRHYQASQPHGDVPPREDVSIFGLRATGHGGGRSRSLYFGFFSSGYQ